MWYNYWGKYSPLYPRFDNAACNDILLIWWLWLVILMAFVRIYFHNTYNMCFPMVNIDCWSSFELWSRKFVFGIFIRKVVKLFVRGYIVLNCHVNIFLLSWYLFYVFGFCMKKYITRQDIHLIRWLHISLVLVTQIMCYHQDIGIFSSKTSLSLDISAFLRAKEINSCARRKGK